MAANIVILGAGPAGLYLALQLLRRKDIQAAVSIIEKEPHVGGNAGSFEWRGMYFDYGSHRLHPATRPEILQDVSALLRGDLLTRPRNGRIRISGRYVRFPLKPLDLFLHLPPSFSMGFARDVLKKVFGRRLHQPDSMAQVLLAGLGETICRDFYFPYAMKIWGIPADQIDAEQARKRVGADSTGKILRKVLASVPGLRPENAGIFYYPKKGFGQICDAMAEEVKALGGRILLATSVDEVILDDGRVAVVRIVNAARDTPERQGAALPADYIFSTIPLTVLAQRLRPAVPAGISESIRQLSYRGMILCYLALATDAFTGFDAHYFPETDIPFSRLSEPKIYSDRKNPAGMTGLCAEIPCAVGDHLWTMTDGALQRAVIEGLEKACLPVACEVLDFRTHRLPNAYPVYPKGYADAFRSLDRYLAAIRGLVTLGRQGLFAHDNTHHAMAMAADCCACITADCRWDDRRWRRHRKAFETHVVED